MTILSGYFLFLWGEVSCHVSVFRVANGPVFANPLRILVWTGCKCAIARHKDIETMFFVEHLVGVGKLLISVATEKNSSPKSASICKSTEEDKNVLLVGNTEVPLCLPLLEEDIANPHVTSYPDCCLVRNIRIGLAKNK